LVLQFLFASHGNKETRGDYLGLNRELELVRTESGLLKRELNLVYNFPEECRTV
jgi:hypothetical protein